MAINGSDFGAQENKICHCFHLCRSLNLLIYSKHNLLTGKMGEIIPDTWSYENWVKYHSKSWTFQEWRSNLSRVVGESPESSPDHRGRELGSWCYHGLQVRWGKGEKWVMQMGFENRKMIQKLSENLLLWAEHLTCDLHWEHSPPRTGLFQVQPRRKKKRGWEAEWVGLCGHHLFPVSYMGVTGKKSS